MNVDDNKSKQLKNDDKFLANETTFEIVINYVSIETNSTIKNYICVKINNELRYEINIATIYILSLLQILDQIVNA